MDKSLSANLNNWECTVEGPACRDSAFFIEKIVHLHKSSSCLSAIYNCLYKNVINIENKIAWEHIV